MSELFYTHFTKLTAEQVAEILKTAPLGGETRLTDSEEIDSLKLTFRREPGALNGVFTISDTDTGEETKIDIWFNGENAPPREIQRKITLGASHKTTDRLIGKAILWESGLWKYQTIYASTVCSSFNRLPDLQTVTAPSDFIAIDDHRYIYSRVEAEFSGAIVVEVFDLITMELAGIRFGIGESDEGELSVYGASGTYLGQLANYSPIKEKPQEAAPAFGAFGDFRMVYRPFEMTHPMTEAEVRANIAGDTAMFWDGSFRGPGNVNSEHMLPTTDLLYRWSLAHGGGKFKLKFDNAPTWEYELTGANTMRFRTDESDAWHEERYEAFESDAKLVLFAHTITGAVPAVSMATAIDLENGLATCAFGHMGNPDVPREPLREFLFGAIEAYGITPSTERHAFTKELVGKSFTWSYTREMTSQHIYSSPESYSWTIFLDDGKPGLMWSSPCQYVKIRDGVYMMSWIESRSAGNLNTFLFNTKTMHDVGVAFGINHNQVFEFNTFGAEARSAGALDLSGIWGK